jgi:hypothetical protein
MIKAVPVGSGQGRKSMDARHSSVPIEMISAAATLGSDNANASEPAAIHRALNLKTHLQFSEQEPFDKVCGWNTRESQGMAQVGHTAWTTAV